MKKISVVLVVVSILAACSSTPQIADQPSSKLGVENFYEVSKLQQFSSAYIRSVDAIQGYDSLMFEPLGLSDFTIDTSRLDRSNDTWTVRPGDKEKAMQHFAGELESAYRGGKRSLTLVGKPSNATLRVAFELVMFKPNAPRDSIKDRTNSASYFAEGAGRLYMKTRVYSAISDELLLVIEDDRELGSTWQQDNRMNNTRRFKQGLNTWIIRLDKALADLQQ